jgi:hypothetical protein
VKATCVVLLGGVILLGACSEPAPKEPRSGRAQISNDVEATAGVVAIEPSARLVTLRREDGLQFQVKCGQEVRNFDQIAVGDRLRVRYKETLTATLRPAGEAAGPVEGVVAAGRAEKGATPAGAVGIGLSVRVKIESIDRERDIVVFSMASGELVSHKIATPEGREFVKGLLVGDTVQLDYTEVLALSIEKL